MARNGAVTRFSVVSPGPPVPSELFSGSSAGAATAFHAKRNAMAAKRNRASGILETHSNGHALFLSQMQRFKLSTMTKCEEGCCFLSSMKLSQPVTFQPPLEFSERGW